MGSVVPGLVWVSAKRFLAHDGTGAKPEAAQPVLDSLANPRVNENTH